MIAIVEISIKENDLSLLASTIKNIANTYFMFGEIKNAIFANFQLKLFSEITGIIKYKIDCFKNLAKCCKKLGKMNESLIFLKKALQYCWYYKELDQELDIYEEIGIIHFHLGNLDKAQMYHEKSMSNEIEPNDSITRNLCKKNIESFFNEAILPLKNIDNIFFERLPSLPFDIIGTGNFFYIF